MRGKMLWFDPAKGFGVITADDDERLYVESGGFLPHLDPGRRCGGRPVTFDRHEKGDGDVRAVNVFFSGE